ncbi:MAG: hypothetical protein V1735_00605 [Nanoarchaeota archaeon]
MSPAVQAMYTADGLPILSPNIVRHAIANMALEASVSYLEQKLSGLDEMLPMICGRLAGQNEINRRGVALGMLYVYDAFRLQQLENRKNRCFQEFSPPRLYHEFVVQYLAHNARPYDQEKNLEGIEISVSQENPQFYLVIDKLIELYPSQQCFLACIMIGIEFQYMFIRGQVQANRVGAMLQVRGSDG